ncbi:MAG: hypothetical protein HQL87_16980 [Magnetococcales bacterium]|nr:hypothetical protein [Magnetococcales bacterium]
MPNYEFSYVTTIISAISAVVATLSAWISSRNFLLSKSKHRLEFFEWRERYFDDMQKWAEGTLELLSESVHLCDIDPKRLDDGDFFNKRHGLLIKLSAKIDTGRWFFPNYNHDEHGIEKESAFRGYRREVLDDLVDAYKLIEKINYVSQAGNKQFTTGHFFKGCREVSERVDFLQ